MSSKFITRKIGIVDDVSSKKCFLRCDCCEFTTMWKATLRVHMIGHEDPLEGLTDSVAQPSSLGIAEESQNMVKVGKLGLMLSFKSD